MTNTLRDRSRGNNPSTEVAQRGPTMAESIAKMEEQFQAAMPRGVEARQLIRDAMTCMRQVPKLSECDQRSVLGSLMTCAQLGLRPGVLGHAWVLPFWDQRSRGHKAQLILGYQGLIELAYRSGKVQSIVARAVYEADDFDYGFGSDEWISHKPNRESDPGQATHYYAIVKLVGGGSAFIVLTRYEAEKHREDHATSRNREGKIVGPWRDHFDQMALKTCIIKLSKWMPKSVEMSHAIAADETVRVNIDPTIQPDEASHQVLQGTVNESREIEPGDDADTDAGPTEDERPDSSPDRTATAEPDRQTTAGDQQRAQPPSTTDLRAEILRAAEQIGMDEWAVEDAFKREQGKPWADASPDDLMQFRRWVLSEIDDKLAPDEGEDKDKDSETTQS